MNSILITGANRGLGLGLVKALINSSKTAEFLPPNYIFATCRNPANATELNQLKEQHNNIHVLELDVTNFDSYENVVKQVENVVKDKGLNVLFNNAGISPKSTRLPFVKAEDLVQTLITNTAAPVILTKAFLPLLKKASQANDQLPMGVKRAAVINMSSILGSITANVEGGMYPYRTSKTGLNAATKSMSIDLKDHKILCISLHPGWVRTDMGGSKAPLDVETASEAIVSTWYKLTEVNNGTLVQYDGKTLPW